MRTSTQVRGESMKRKDIICGVLDVAEQFIGRNPWK
jgi:hypothetical protein